MKLLLHACCAPCSIQCVEALREEGLNPELCWYNPNIHPYTEYISRRDALRAFCEDQKLTLIMEDEYGLRSFIRAVENGLSIEANAGAGQGLAANPRCVFCYQLRLEEIAALAADRGYGAFSTTLLISPYQNHDLIRETGEALAALYGVPFLYRDFRPRFRQGQSQARSASYYMQKYCGCIYSEEERFLPGSKIK